MSRIERADKIEGLVGARRHLTVHFARAVSAEQRVYILHSHNCLWEMPDLRQCVYSIALDYGIDLGVWDGREDQVVALEIDAEHGDLLPLPLNAELASHVSGDLS